MAPKKRQMGPPSARERWNQVMTFQCPFSQSESNDFRNTTLNLTLTLALTLNLTLTLTLPLTQYLP